MRRITPLLAVACTAIGSRSEAQSVTVAVTPTRVLVERSACCHLINFDLELHSSARDTLLIESVTATFLGPRGETLARREVGLNGMAPSINLLNTRTVPPDKDITLFNPFYSLDRGLEYSSIRYDIQLVGRSDTVSASALVKPERWQPKTDLVLPLQGRILVHDGHDFYSHHRRMDMALLRSFKVLKRQFNRYAYDFVLVDSMGRMNRTGGKTNEDWFGYGATVFATGDGIVRYAVNDAAEHHLPDADWSQEQTLSNPRGIPGNNVVIDHGNGECSAMAHLKQGSVRVKVGDRVRRGQPIAAMGLSGDSDWLPHVHYQLMDSCDFLDAEGLPSYFTGFTRAGFKGGPETRGQVDTGDILFVPVRTP